MPWPKGKPMTPEMVAKQVATRLANGAKRKKPLLVDGVERWVCAGCQRPLPASKFFVHRRSTNGLSSRCKPCHSQQAIETRDYGRHRIARREHARAARESDPERVRARERDASRRRPKDERAVARAKLNAAVRRGELVRPTACPRCGITKKVTAHHPDYSKPLDVEWLCYQCHADEHFGPVSP